jgi:hypothetical protein
MPTYEKGNDLAPVTAERGDALQFIKEYARKGYAQTGEETEEEFE